MGGNSGKVIGYLQAGGFGTRLSPLLHQPGLNSMKILSVGGRNLTPWNHNGYSAVPKPILPYFGTALSAPMVRSAVKAGVKDIRATIYVQPDIVIDYYKGKSMGGGVSVEKFLYEHKPLDTSGGIVRDVVAGINDGTISKDDTILVMGGDIRTDVDIADFLAQHNKIGADISIVLAQVPREEMHRFGAALRKGDATQEVERILMQVGDKQKDYAAYGELKLNPDQMAEIVRFFEKTPKLVSDVNTIVHPPQVIVEEILEKFGCGALAPTNLQNGSIYAIRAELIYNLAPLVFNLPKDAPARAWENSYDINISGPSKFSDFGGDWFMVLTGSKSWPQVNSFSPMAKEQQRIIDEFKANPPTVFGYKHTGKWSDDGTLRSVLQGHKDILDDLIANGQNASWPINWEGVRSGYPAGVITMSNFNVNKVTLIPPVFIGPGVIIHDNAVIGPYAVINRDWEVAGTIRDSVLFPKKRIDREIEGARGWKRFTVYQNWTINNSLVGSGFEIEAMDATKGDTISLKGVQGTQQIPGCVNRDGAVTIDDSVVVSNGARNVVSSLDI
jgi:NDP-sugar pyrophosphorylase family protein